VKDGPGTSDS